MLNLSLSGSVYCKQCPNTTIDIANDFTISIYPNDDNTIKLKYGCPSREEINIPYDEEFANKCYTCSYFSYCKGDCECFNNICTFPKKWFNYIKENCID